MSKSTKIKITELNRHLTCFLCAGYFIDATTIIECLHSFCRTCIVPFLQKTNQCPMCDVQVHKTRPLLNIRADKTLQSLVYKLVPGLLKNEMCRRREYFSLNPDARRSLPPNAREERGELGLESLFIYTDDEDISLSMEYRLPRVAPPHPPPPLNEKPEDDEEKPEDESERKRRHSNTNGIGEGELVDLRYLRCAAAVTIKHLKKFVRSKFGLDSSYQIDVFYKNSEEEVLFEDYSLMDIAYIFSWRRTGPLALVYRIYEPNRKRRKLAKGKSSVNIKKTLSKESSNVFEKTAVDDKKKDTNNSNGGTSMTPSIGNTGVAVST
ncbi:polycomb complex protein BMI-1-like isoform X2 [Anneissia japonica]|nr:polycomb complex protein BMI-1-like isoform X2 [Anneissia japonica]XP_033099289.1 polycomb complex protein BMI-1-like isoform X2 [Anneissia japonica]